MQDSSAGVKLEKQSQEKDPERFYCPFPGCNRSFAELWRLKVHYRAPPDIRGSGKERGHGTELTQCPKCGKSLKPGKHHVGCSAGRSAPRQTTKRTRLAVPDPSILDLAVFKDDQASIGDGLMPESFMQQLVGSFPQHMFGMDGQHHMPMPDMLHQQQQQHQMLQMSFTQQQHDFNMLQAQMGFVQQQMPMYQQVPQAPQQPQLQQQQPPAQQQSQHMQQQHTQQQQQPPPQQHSDPTDLSAMFASFPNATIAPVQQQPAAASGPTLNFTPDDSLNFFNLFDYADASSGTPAPDGQPPTPPSPPPLPADFDARPSNMLFQFSQFSQKLPSSLTPASLPNDSALPHLSTADASDPWTGGMGYEKSNDGDLMHILFGLPDEYPTMATVHLHQFEQPASCTAPKDPQLIDPQQHHHQQRAAAAGSMDVESPRFAGLINCDLESSLDLFTDAMDADDDCITGPNSGTSSMTAMEPASTSGKGSLLKGEESHAESSQAASSSRKDSLGEDSLEPLLSPTALVKGDKPVLPRTSTFERELYHLLRPCE